MNIKVKDGTQVFEVSRHSCTCQEFRALLKQGKKCKHILSAFNYPAPVVRMNPDEEKQIMDFFQLGVPYMVAFSVYGDKLKEWLKSGKIVAEEAYGKTMLYLK